MQNAISNTQTAQVLPSQVAVKPVNANQLAEQNAQPQVQQVATASKLTPTVAAVAQLNGQTAQNLQQQQPAQQNRQLTAGLLQSTVAQANPPVPLIQTLNQQQNATIQDVVGRNDVNGGLASRQSKYSLAAIQAANEEVRLSRQQQVAGAALAADAPSNKPQTRQSKLFLNNQPLLPTSRAAASIKPSESGQNKLLLADQAAPPSRRPDNASRKTSNQAARPPRLDLPPLGSRQSKLSVFDMNARPDAFQQTRRASRRSNRSTSTQRSVKSPTNSENAVPNFLQIHNRRLTPMSGGRILTASSNALTTYSNYETLKYLPLVVGRENPEIFTEGISYDGWISEPNAVYPIDLILGFDHISNVYKVYLSVTDHLTPSKVEIRVGKRRAEDREPTYETARKAAYKLKATINFEKRYTELTEKETKVAFLDSECQYIWILFFAPHSSKLNPTNQIRITELNVEGYLIKPRRQRSSRSVNSFRDPTPTRHSFRRSRSRATTAVSNVSNSFSVFESRHGRSSRVSSVLGSSISEGDAWKSSGDNLASDPLMAVRLVRNLLAKKQKRCLRRGRDVEATLCLRATETLDSYEKQMSTIRTRMSEAMQKANFEEAKKQELALIDCRDTAFRVIHLDLLLENAELRAVGVQSKYADSVSLR